MKYLKVQVSLPVVAIEKLKKSGNLSAKIEEIIERYIDEPLDPLPSSVRTRTVVLSLSYEIVRKIKQRKKLKVKDFISAAVFKEMEND